MASKPTELPRWATDETNNVEPSAGSKNSGYGTNAIPTSAELNWMMWATWLWIAWLNDALVDFGDPVTVRAGELATPTLSPGGSDPWVTVAGGLYANGDVGHGNRYLNVSPLSFQHDGNWQIGFSVSFADAGYVVSTGAGRCIIPIPMRAGDRIQSVTFARYGDGAADITAVEVYKLDKDGVLTNIAPATSVTNPAASWADTTVDVADTILGDTDCLYMRIAANAANIRIGSIRVLHDRPAPP